MTSSRVDRLSVAAELFYRRLHSVVDDQGRFEANPELLRTACYPLRVDKVRGRQIIQWLDDCARARLVVIYAVDEKRYLQITDWRQPVRSKPRNPGPPAGRDADATQMLSDDAHMKADAKPSTYTNTYSNTNTNVGSSAEALSPGVNGNAVAYIPLNDGSEFPVAKDFAEELSRLFPAVDVPQTLNEIRAWNLANPARRKTARGVRGHIAHWMGKEQNRGPKA